MLHKKRLNKANNGAKLRGVWSLVIDAVHRAFTVRFNNGLSDVQGVGSPLKSFKIPRASPSRTGHSWYQGLVKWACTKPILPPPLHIKGSIDLRLVSAGCRPNGGFIRWFAVGGGTTRCWVAMLQCSLIVLHSWRKASAHTTTWVGMECFCSQSSSFSAIPHTP